MSKSIRICLENPGQSTLNEDVLKYDWWKKSFTVNPAYVNVCFKLLKDSFLQLSVYHADRNHIGGKFTDTKNDLIKHGLTSKHFEDSKYLPALNKKALNNMWELDNFEHSGILK